MKNGRNYAEFCLSLLDPLKLQGTSNKQNIFDKRIFRRRIIAIEGMIIGGKVLKIILDVYKYSQFEASV